MINQQIKALNIAKKFQIPIYFIGLGEKDDDLHEFDAEKYADTNISKLLNEGAEQISQGAKVGVVTRRIQPKIINEIFL